MWPQGPFELALQETMTKELNTGTGEKGKFGLHSFWGHLYLTFESTVYYARLEVTEFLLICLSGQVDARFPTQPGPFWEAAERLEAFPYVLTSLPLAGPCHSWFRTGPSNPSPLDNLQVSEVSLHVLCLLTPALSLP